MNQNLNLSAPMGNPMIQKNNFKIQINQNEVNQPSSSEVKASDDYQESDNENCDYDSYLSKEDNKKFSKKTL